MENKPPSIRGLFVNSHIKALRKAKGERAVLELEKDYGLPLKFGNLQYVPVKEEVKIIDLVLKRLTDAPVAQGLQDYEVGKLHFKNFMATAFAKILFPVLGRNFKLVIWVASKVSRGIFSGVKVHKQSGGVYTEKIILENSGYPIKHFTGFFDAWLEHLNLIGMATAKEVSSGSYEYTITWKKSSG